MIRKRYDFTGQVQHVGFRRRARKAAGMFGCTGWCRNNPDGSVTMEIQGTRVQILLVLMAVRRSRRIRILKTSAVRISPVAGEQGFLRVTE